MKKYTLLFVLVTTVMVSAVCAAADVKSVKVFILAGQSNMEGKAQNKLLNHQATDPKTAHLFKHLRADGQWIVRDDVFIKFLDRKGGLTIGYGSRDRTGIELEFGTMMGNHYDEPVLLIKTAWGGHSLQKPFRPPSRGLPTEEALQAELKQAQNRVTKNNEKRKRNDPLPTMEEIKAGYGQSYRNMMADVQNVMKNAGSLFPELDGMNLELTGFLWFQGFNDKFGNAPAEYESNITHFIKDVRRDLHAPNLPFVIVAIGTNGSKEAKGGGLTVRSAQLAMNDVPEFAGNVKAFRTDLLVDKTAEALFPGWQNHLEEWSKVGSDRPYHYLGSAIWYGRIGKAFGEAMLDLKKNE